MKPIKALLLIAAGIGMATANDSPDEPGKSNHVIIQLFYIKLIKDIIIAIALYIFKILILCV